ncbi:MAG: ABC transporter substrate-binding protein [Prevotella sp.]|nr:ABC transporter substrate-binding protein [Prevotella sp.]
MKKLFVYIVLLVVATGIYSCGGSFEEKLRQSHRDKLKLEREDSAALKIATTPTMDCLPLFIGVEDSLFQKAGVVVHLRARNSQIDGDTLIEGGHVEGFVTDLIRAERLQKRGTPLKYVAATNLYWQIISNRIARVKDIKQLSDKMIAITRYSATDYLANLAVDSAHPKYDVYRIQINDVKIRLKMLLNNEMDAIVIPEPQATTARLNTNPVLMDSRHRDYRLGVIAFREKALKDKSRQKQLALFLKVYNEICDSINSKGTTHYSKVITKYMGVDDKTVKALPHLNYQHATPPRASDVDRARKYWH